MIKKGILLFVTLVISVILCTDISIIFNIPIIRQITSFIFLTFIPGLLIIQILKLNKINSINKIVIMLGLSLIFILFSGISINNIFYSKPLQTYFILTIYNVIYIILLLFGIVINKDFLSNYSIPQPPKINSFEKISLILSILLIFCSIVGTSLVKSNQNFTFLYFLLFLIPSFIIFISFSHRKINENFYPFAIFSISVSIILAYTLISNYIYGSDSHSEFYLYQLVLISGKWQLFGSSSLDSCLSISILPAIYQLLLKMEPTFLFKIVFVLPLSISPVIVYQIAKNYYNSLYAFLAAVFVIASASFYVQTEAYRTYIAVFFFALAIMVFLEPQIKDINKKLLFILFSVGIIVSHYSTAYIFVILILTSIFMMYFLKLLVQIKNKSFSSRNIFNDNNKFFSLSLFLLMAVIIFLWYSQVTGESFDNGVLYITKTLAKFGQFFDLEARDPVVYQAAGTSLSKAPIIRYINFLTSWTSIISMIMGVIIGLITFLDMKHIKRKFRVKFDYNLNDEFLSWGVASVILMGFSVIMPFVLVFYSLPRLYYMLIIILSIFFIIGAKYFSNLLKINKQYIFILVLLIPILLSSSGVTPQFFGEPNSILLNPPEKINNSFYVHDQEAFSAQWLKESKESNKTFYSDTNGRRILISIAMVPQDNLVPIQKNPKGSDVGYTYLSYRNIINGTLSFWRYTTTWDEYQLKDFSKIFDKENLIYDNGGSKILQNF